MTAELTTRVLAADEQAITEAARCLAAGGLVAFPTETVYGLGADATDGGAIARLYAAKGRPSFNPLIAHVADLAAARVIAELDRNAEQLATNFWPGPLTLVLKRRADCPVAELATAGLDSIAVRVPNHPIANRLLRALGRRPVVAPSANRSGHVSPTTAAHVFADLRGRIDLILDGGPTEVGIESTIVSCLGLPALLRPGGLPRSDIERVLNVRLTDSPPGTMETDARLAPGMLASHYAPHSRLRLGANSVRDGEALLAFGPAPSAGAERAVRVLNLSATGDLVEASANLFSHLRSLDALNATIIAVMPIPREGLGEAINDRLSRAAAPKGNTVP